MSNTFRTSFLKLKNEHLCGLFQALEQVLQDQGIDFYFVGAFARDVWNTVHNIPPGRITRDIDLAVLIPSATQFQELRERLITDGRFQPASGNDIKFFFEDTTELDLIPFGGFDIFSDGALTGLMAYIALPDNGFQEVYEAATELVQFEEVGAYKVCALPGIVLLKLLAYDNVPEYRPKDMQDIFHIIRHYFDIADDLIYEGHLDLFGEDFDTTTAGARVLGREMRPILQRNAKLEARIVDMLEKAVTEGGDGKMAVQMVQGTDEEAAVAASWIKAILEGIRD